MIVEFKVVECKDGTKCDPMSVQNVYVNGEKVAKIFENDGYTQDIAEEIKKILLTVDKDIKVKFIPGAQRLGN